MVGRGCLLIVGEQQCHFQSEELFKMWRINFNSEGVAVLSSGLVIATFFLKMTVSYMTTSVLKAEAHKCFGVRVCVCAREREREFHHYHQFLAVFELKGALIYAANSIGMVGVLQAAWSPFEVKRTRGA